MEKLILLIFRVVDPSDRGAPCGRELLLRVFRSHTWAQVKAAISGRHRLDANSLIIEHGRHGVSDAERVGDYVAAGLAYNRQFALLIDSDGSEVLAEVPPCRVHMVRGTSIQVVEVPLDSTVSHLKHVAGIQSLEQLFYQRGEITSDYILLLDVIEVDAAPVEPVEVRVVPRHCERVRVHTVSEVPAALNLIVEVPRHLTMGEVKRRLIEAIDANLVARTGYDLLLIREVVDLADLTLLALVVAPEDLIVLWHVLVRPAPGILSNEFLRDLTLSQRFQFMPPAQPEPANDMVTMEPMRVLIDGRQIELTGHAFEQVSDGTEVLYVDQHHLSCTSYHLRLEVDGAVKEVTLNESQVIIVDNNPQHEPYMILSPLGASRVYQEFKDASGRSLLQRVKVLMYEPEVPPPQAPRQTWWEMTRAAYRMFSPVISWVVLSALKFLVFAQIFNLHVFTPVWAYIMAWAVAITGSFALFVAGNTVAGYLERLLPPRAPEEVRPGYERAVQRVANGFRWTLTLTREAVLAIFTETVRIGVERPYDWEYILGSQDNWWIRTQRALGRVAKDVLVYFLTLAPPMQHRINAERAAWQDREFESLLVKTKNFAELVEMLIDEYNALYEPAYELPQGLDFSRVEGVVTVRPLVPDDNSDGAPNQDNVETPNAEAANAEAPDAHAPNTDEPNEEGDGAPNIVAIEQNYCLLIDCYRAYHRAYLLLNHSLVKREPIAGGHRRAA